MRVLSSLVAVSALWIAGCDTTESDDAATGTTLAISGVIVNHDGSTAREIRATPRQYADETYAVAAVAADGSFNLGGVTTPSDLLPTDYDPNDVSPSCVGAVVLSDSTVRSTTLVLRLFEGGSEIGDVRAATFAPEQTPTPTDYVVEFEYFDKPFEATGYVECDYSRLPEDTSVVRTNYDLQISAGWNKIARRFVSFGPDASRTTELFTPDPPPDANEFYWMPYDVR
ncbi:MAG: hypothetical protein GF419_04010 [Ignavibacteriales bacterium]|nr:hypothetical protein [Ignavibacteriales bacterium]